MPTTLSDELFDLAPEQGFTYALVCMRGGEIVHERYEWGHTQSHLQYSWSMAKSITHALVGIAVRDGLIELGAPVAVPEWADDQRATITLSHLLAMRSGLEFGEEYFDGSSDVVDMLFGEGRHDMAAYAAAKPLVHAPGSVFHYSSGTTNIICRLLQDTLRSAGDDRDMLRYMRDELFEPARMRSATPRFDTVGTFVGSSWCLCSPRDFARFGQLYLDDGTVDGQRVLPEGWRDHAAAPTTSEADEGYGSHWWLPGADVDAPSGAFYAGGFEGQRIIVVPERDLVIVRCGRTHVDQMPYIDERLYELADAL